MGELLLVLVGYGVLMTEGGCTISRRKRVKTSGGRRPKTGRGSTRVQAEYKESQEERGQAQGLAEYGVSYG